MSNIQDIVDSLENRTSKLLHKMELLKQANSKLNQELTESRKKYLEKEKELLSWRDKYESLKVASSMLGSDENKRETKLKINALIREIDNCIVQLSE